jgi:hypothetical protein
MIYRRSAGIVCINTLLVLCMVTDVVSEEKAIAETEKVMEWQLDAVREGEYKRFLLNGNKAFKEMIDEWTFDSWKMHTSHKLKKGYTLVYLGSIRRTGMVEHLWKVKIKDEMYELLGKLTLANGKVVGFDIQ